MTSVCLRVCVFVCCFGIVRASIVCCLFDFDEMEVEQRFPRMQLVRKAAEQYQRLILERTRPSLVVVHQQVHTKMQKTILIQPPIHRHSLHLKTIFMGATPVIPFQWKKGAAPAAMIAAILTLYMERSRRTAGEVGC